MKNPNRYSIPFRRKREEKTNYAKRLKLLSSDKPRLVVRRSLNNITVQIVKFKPEGDFVVAAATSRDVEKFGWKYNKKNIPCAYLVGYLIGKRAAEKKIHEAIADIGLFTSVKGSRLYAAIKGAIDGGLKVPCSKEILPADDRIKGKHICSYRKINEADFAKNFEAVLAKIKGGK